VGLRKLGCKRPSLQPLIAAIPDGGNLFANLSELAAAFETRPLGAPQGEEARTGVAADCSSAIR
jgi:hypothetical protein